MLSIDATLCLAASIDSKARLQEVLRLEPQLEPAYCGVEPNAPGDVLLVQIMLGIAVPKLSMTIYTRA